MTKIEILFYILILHRLTFQLPHQATFLLFISSKYRKCFCDNSNRWHF